MTGWEYAKLTSSWTAAEQAGNSWIFTNKYQLEIGGRIVARWRQSYSSEKEWAIGDKGALEPDQMNFPDWNLRVSSLSDLLGSKGWELVSSHPTGSVLLRDSSLGWLADYSTPLNTVSNFKRPII